MPPPTCRSCFAGSGMEFVWPFPGEQADYEDSQYDLIALHSVLDRPNMVRYLRHNVGHSPPARNNQMKPIFATILRQPIERTIASLNFKPWQRFVLGRFPSAVVHDPAGPRQPWREVLHELEYKTAGYQVSYCARPPCQPSARQLWVTISTKIMSKIRSSNQATFP